jgi:hypothetical protein
MAKLNIFLNFKMEIESFESFSVGVECSELNTILFPETVPFYGRIVQRRPAAGGAGCALLSRVHHQQRP